MIYLDPKHSRAYADTRAELDEAGRLAGAAFSRLVPGTPPCIELTPIQARRVASDAVFIDGWTIRQIALRWARQREAFRVGFALRAAAAALFYVIGATPVWS